MSLAQDGKPIADIKMDVTARVASLLRQEWPTHTAKQAAQALDVTTYRARSWCEATSCPDVDGLFRLARYFGPMLWDQLAEAINGPDVQRDAARDLQAIRATLAALEREMTNADNLARPVRTVRFPRGALGTGADRVSALGGVARRSGA